MTGLEALEMMADQKEITLTKGQLKELIRDAMQEGAALAQKTEAEQEPKLTKEQILNIKDSVTRQRLMSKNMHLFT